MKLISILFQIVQDIMRAGVLPCTALIHECNAGNIISPEACLGAFITCNYAETVPYQLSGKQKNKRRSLLLREFFKNSGAIYYSDKILAGEVTEYQIKCYLHPLFTFAVFYLCYFSTFLIGNLPEKQMVAELIKNSSQNFVIIISMYFRLQPIRHENQM